MSLIMENPFFSTSAHRLSDDQIRQEIELLSTILASLQSMLSPTPGEVEQQVQDALVRYRHELATRDGVGQLPRSGKPPSEIRAQDA